jgi:predicted transposase YdaD
MQQGMQQGYKNGIEDGKQKGLLEAAVKMVKEFNIDIAEVAKKFNLSIELIKRNL